MSPIEPNEKIIQLLLARLERISVDSHLAHRASGVRGALTRQMEKIEKGESPQEPEAAKKLIELGFLILEQAAKEKS